jgi:GH35 family endo-1,4-beta-xylanase
MILDKVQTYLAQNGERLDARNAARTKQPVTGFKKSKQTNHSLAQVRADGTTLKDAADGLGVYIGSAMKYKNMLADEDEEEPLYASTFVSEFDIATVENWCKPAQMLKSTDDTLENSYAKYDGCHYMNDWMIENDIAHRGHALVWPAPGKYPDWFEALTDDDAIEEHMINWIIEVMNEMGELYAWDVVNEVIHNSTYEYKDTVFKNIDDFVCSAFKTAKTVADENGWDTLMFYNEYDFESMVGEFAGKSDAVYDLMEDLVTRDCGIDGVGFQTHLDIGYSDDDIQGIADNF